MKLDLVKGEFLRRYKRFFADVQLPTAELAICHCPNTGSMKTLLHEGLGAWIEASNNPKRKLKWTLITLETPGGGRAMVQTHYANDLVAEAIEAGRIPELAGYGKLRREVAYGSRKSRIDFLLEDDDEVESKPSCYVEVKNCTMLSATAERRCDFPDAVTARGLKHLAELKDMVQEGHRVVQFYLLSRNDCDRLGIAQEIDPAYAEALNEAAHAGVEVLCYNLNIGDSELLLASRMPIDMPR